MKKKYAVSGISPVVSIVIPFKNAAETLEEAILSIQVQSLHNSEIILVNNGSTDQSLEIAQKAAAADNRIQVLNEPHPGVALANNLGMTQARGTYLARMDADDVSFPDRLQRQVAFLENNPTIDVVSGLVEHWPQIADSRGIAHYVNWVNQLLLPHDLYLNRFIELPVINPTLLFRRTLLEQVALYRQGDFPEDFEMVLRWMEAGLRFGKVNAPVLRWRDTSGRLTRTDTRYSPEAFYEVKTAFFARWLLKKHIGSVMIWGAGKKSRQRARLLESQGIALIGFIDVDPKKLKQPTDLHYNDLPVHSENSPFIAAYVSNRGARNEIKDFLQKKGYHEGKDFLLLA